MTLPRQDERAAAGAYRPSPRPTFDGPELTCYLLVGSRHEYRNFGDVTARAIFGVAPDFLERP
jgi:hypothetical protein